MRSFLAAAVLALAANAAMGGPLGLDMGMTLAEAQRTGSVAPSKSRHVYTLTRHPSREEPFVAYQLFLTPVSGLCKIVAIGPVLRTTADGSAVRSAFREEEKLLERRYGKHERLEEGKPGSETPETDDWMTGLWKQARSFSAYWYEAGQSGLTDGLRAVKLEANGLGRDRGYLSVAYEFRNFGDCLAEDKESGRAGL